MTGFEFIYNCIRPFEHPLYQHVWRTIRWILSKYNDRGRLLDIGGRRSNYTIGLLSEIWITDVKRESIIQKKLDLGVNESIKKNVVERRSNVKKYLYDDMTSTALPEDYFDVIIAIEVLEHVEYDGLFLDSVRRLLRKGGTFVMTTPNGDNIPNPYPEHKRHYRMAELKSLLSMYFDEVNIEYRVNSGKLFNLGLHKWSAKTPLRTLVSMCAFFMSDLIESRICINEKESYRKLHIVAVCRSAKKTCKNI